MSDNLTVTRESPWLSAAYDFLPTITGPRPDSSQATMNPRLADVWVQPSRYKVLYGGRGSSKTWEAAAHAIRIAQAARVRILCTRQFQSKIEDSVYTTKIFVWYNGQFSYGITGDFCKLKGVYK